MFEHKKRKTLRSLTETEIRTPRKIKTILTFSIIIGFTFGVPHLLIPKLMGKQRTYTPFAVSGVSSLTYDKTYLYAAQVNYTAIRWKPAYDTDTFEYKDIPSMFPTIPHFAMAGLARILGGIDRAFIASDFLFPSLAFILLYLLIFDLTKDFYLSITGAIFVLVIPFGPRNFIGSAIEILTKGHTSQIQPLEYSRYLHPQFSFTLLVAGWLFLWRTWAHSRLRDAVVAGLLGGLLFYTYLYYWVPWVGACTIFLILEIARKKRAYTPLGLVNLLMWAVGSLFWLIFFQAHRFPNYLWRLSRFGLESRFALMPEKLKLSLAYIFLFGIFTFFFKSFVAPNSNLESQKLYKKSLMFHAVIFLSAILALNAEMILGFNVEALCHYPNRFFQPLLSLALISFAGPAFPLYLKRAGDLSGKWWKAIGFLLSIVLLAFSLLRQVGVSINVAPKHEYQQEYQLLFSWLNRNTQVDDVVIASNREINYLIPVYTHNRPFVPSGTRSTASSEEIMRRFLTAFKLLGHSEQSMRTILIEPVKNSCPFGCPYGYYLFQKMRMGFSLLDENVTKLLGAYSQLNMVRELQHFRADYIYTEPSEDLQSIKGYTFDKVYKTPYGALWRISKSQPTSVNAVNG